jgi:hypothetical protein
MSHHTPSTMNKNRERERISCECPTTRSPQGIRRERELIALQGIRREREREHGGLRTSQRVVRVSENEPVVNVPPHLLHKEYEESARNQEDSEPYQE